MGFSVGSIFLLCFLMCLAKGSLHGNHFITFNFEFRLSSRSPVVVRPPTSVQPPTPCATAAGPLTASVLELTLLHNPSSLEPNLPAHGLRDTLLSVSLLRWIFRRSISLNGRQKDADAGGNALTADPLGELSHFICLFCFCQKKKKKKVEHVSAYAVYPCRHLLHIRI